MEAAKSHDGTIVCSNPDAMRSKAFMYGIYNLNFVSYYDFIYVEKNNNNHYYIDEIEEFIKFLGVNGNFEGYTLSEDD